MSLSKLLRKCVLTGLCLLTAIPHYSFAYYGNCCEQESKFWVNPGLAIGALILGAAAGAGTGYAAGNRNCGHKRTCCQKQSCCKKGPCKAEECKLTFNMQASLEVVCIIPAGTYSSSFQYFASTPNGCTVFSDEMSYTDQTILAEPIFLLMPSRSLTLPACCGTYQFGFNFEITSENQNPVATINIGEFTNSVADCKGNTENIIIANDYLSIPIDLTEEGFDISIAPYSVQFITPYTYQPNECVTTSTCDCSV